jgi:integrase/recombinase XerD
MLLKTQEVFTCNTMGNTVSPTKSRKTSVDHPHPPSTFSLYAPRLTSGGASGGGRKYLNRDERRRVLTATNTLDERTALFVLTLAWTGARISEVLALTPSSFQIEQSLVSIVTLKRRGWYVREIPVPPEIMRRLDRAFALRSTQQNSERADKPLWPMSRTTAWRRMKCVMDVAKVSGGCACPRGLRHGFGVGTLQAGVPITLVQRWLGHARLSTTAIYAEVAGPEEFAMAARFWSARDDGE